MGVNEDKTGLYFCKARFYDPEIGRFLSADAWLGELDQPPSLHRYA
jgi:RHS repeat-associated protein